MHKVLILVVTKNFMEKKKVATIIASILLLSVGFLMYFTFSQGGKIQGSTINNGGQRDKYGCLIHLGYTWNDTEQACVRDWINGTGRYQVNNFSDCVDAGYNLTDNKIANLTNESNVTFLRQCETPGGIIFVENTNTSYSNVSSDNLTNGSWIGNFNVSNNSNSTNIS